MMFFIGILVGILAGCGTWVYVWILEWKKVAELDCSCGRNCTAPTLVMSVFQGKSVVVKLPQCDACYNWLMHGNSYNHPPWSKKNAAG
jgi:hypothetical protein